MQLDLKPKTLERWSWNDYSCKVFVNTPMGSLDFSGHTKGWPDISCHTNRHHMFSLSHTKGSKCSSEKLVTHQGLTCDTKGSSIYYLKEILGRCVQSIQLQKSVNSFFKWKGIVLVKLFCELFHNSPIFESLTTPIFEFVRSRARWSRTKYGSEGGRKNTKNSGWFQSLSVFHFLLLT